MASNIDRESSHSNYQNRNGRRNWNNSPSRNGNRNGNRNGANWRYSPSRNEGINSQNWRQPPSRNEGTNGQNWNHPPSRNEGRIDQNHQNILVHHYSPYSGSIPFWKLIMLRHAYDDDQMIEFPPYSDSCYRNKNGSNSHYDIRCLNPTDCRQDEIKAIASIFQQWIENVMIRRLDSASLDNTWITVRYGCLYLTSLSPYVDTLSVKEFKQQFNGILGSNTCNRDNSPFKRRLTTGFFPIYNNFPTQMQSLDGSQFVFEEEIERIRVSLQDTKNPTLSFVEYDGQMQVSYGSQYKKYFKLDIKDNISGNDVRICIISGEEKEIEDMSSQMRDVIVDISPPIIRDSSNNSIEVRPKYRKCIQNVRYKKIKSYKLTKEVQLWDTFRQATTVDLCQISEYLYLDSNTGQFKEKNDKTEINLNINSLKELLTDENCQLFAENLYQLTFTILPQYINSIH